jgi:lipoprotein-anchoring transpeptidase ErfK/SrfK
VNDPDAVATLGRLGGGAIITGDRRTFPAAPSVNRSKLTKHGLSVSVLLACAAAGVLAALALANGGPPLPMATTTTVGTTVGTTTPGTTTATTTTVGTTTTVTTPQPLPEGVTVGGVPVGSLLPAEAAQQIRNYFSSPLPLRLGRRVFKANPNTLAAPKVTKALERARVAQPFANLPLGVTVRTPRVRRYVATVARRVEKQPVDSRLLLRNLKPYLTPDQAGIILKQPETVSAITAALRLNVRDRIPLRTKQIRANVTRANFGPVIVIRRGSNRLFLYSGMRVNRLFPVATGQSVYPTPLGNFQIIVKWRNPWWYPPNSAWAQGEKPIPPGPGNPLGTRWMGISAPGVGIHGTNNDASIGYSVSHGCIRMHVSDAEWLFTHVEIGTPVFIVGA